MGTEKGKGQPKITVILEFRFRPDGDSKVEKAFNLILKASVPTDDHSVISPTPDQEDDDGSRE